MKRVTSKKNSGLYRFQRTIAHAGIAPLDHQCSMDNIALNDSGAI
jgi:hypothetical protein